MGQRLQLHSKLCDILESSHVYFQPPTGTKLIYPCIVYELDDMDTKYADNNPYLITRGYSITAIDRNPDSIYPQKIAEMPMTSFNRMFVSDNLYHYVFTTYF